MVWVAHFLFNSWKMLETILKNAIKIGRKVTIKRQEYPLDSLLVVLLHGKAASKT